MHVFVHSYVYEMLLCSKCMLCLTAVSKDSVIDELYYLQHYKEGWDEWEEKMDRRPCIQNPYHFVSLSVDQKMFIFLDFFFF